MNRRAAFSLVETVLALGLSASVLTAAMALLPLGLQTTSRAERRHAEEHIFRYVSDRCATASSSSKFWFSSNGSPLPAENPDAAFSATILSGPRIAVPGNPEPTMRPVTITLRDRSPGWQLTRTLLLPP